MNSARFAIGSRDETQMLLFWVKYSGSPIGEDELKSLAPLLSDQVDQDFWVNPAETDFLSRNFDQVQIVHFRAGVTDNPAKSFQELLAFHPSFNGRKTTVHSGELFFHEQGARAIGTNPLIQVSFLFRRPGPAPAEWPTPMEASPSMKGARVKKFSLSSLSDEALITLSRDQFWALSSDEMKVIQNHFGSQEITDVEIEVLAQTWSEHCKHKIFGATIDYEEAGKPPSRIESLYKTFIQKPTTEIQAKKGWAISVFKDNAGIVRFHDDVDLCIKVETHNSPSALDPYGGALTGILGVNRDILGTGLGARPIANTNVLCFGRPDETHELPKGLLHPKEVLRGVHHGIQDGGNKSGIPTINGAMLFDDSFAGKPLVFCGTVGVLPRKVKQWDSASKNQRPGDLIVSVGGAVGLDGIHGATASSLALDASTPSSMVQIGDPLTQKRVSDFLLKARDQGLYNSLTDNGAGGLSSSIGEMAGETGGAMVHLEQVPLKYPGLLPWQIFVSESQERMTLSVPKESWPALCELAGKMNVSTTIVGEFTNSGKLELFYAQEAVGSLSLDFLHDGLPKMKLRAKWSGPRPLKTWKPEGEPQKPELPSAKEILLSLAHDPSLASKEKWVRQYDHEVQGATVVKPFEGFLPSAPNDGGVIWMGAHGNKGFEGAVVASGICPDFGRIDPELMAKFAVDEAVRNAIVTGADPEKLALVDNFCWPDPLPGAKNPDAEQKLAELVRTCRGLAEICRAYGMPLVSGKDSMKNDFIGKLSGGTEVKISVLPTLLVTALAHHPDVRQVIKPHAKVGAHLYVMGAALVDSYFGVTLPKHFSIASKQDYEFDLNRAREFYSAFFEASKQGFIASAHDVSEGGILFALFETLMLYSGGIDLAQWSSTDTAKLFSEIPAQFVVSVSSTQRSSFEKHFSSDVRTYLGEVNPSGVIRFKDSNQASEITVNEVANVWRSSL